MARISWTLQVDEKDKNKWKREVAFNYTVTHNFGNRACFDSTLQEFIDFNGPSCQTKNVLTSLKGICGCLEIHRDHLFDDILQLGDFRFGNTLYVRKTANSSMSNLCTEKEKVFSSSK